MTIIQKSWKKVSEPKLNYRICSAGNEEMWGKGNTSKCRGFPYFIHQNASELNIVAFSTSVIFKYIKYVSLLMS